MNMCVCILLMTMTNKNRGRSNKIIELFILEILKLLNTKIWFHPFIQQMVLFEFLNISILCKNAMFSSNFSSQWSPNSSRSKSLIIFWDICSLGACSRKNSRKLSGEFNFYQTEILLLIIISICFQICCIFQCSVSFWFMWQLTLYLLCSIFWIFIN